MPSDTPTLDQPAPPAAPRRRRHRAGLLLAAAALVLLAACTPQQMREWYDSQGVDHSRMSEQEVADAAAFATQYWAAIFAENEELARYEHVLSSDQLYRLRMCESTDNYQAVSSTGLYRGAYQFHQGTWDSIARQHLPRYVGIDPSWAPPHIQDGMTRILWSKTGPRSWPVCGYRV